MSPSSSGQTISSLITMQNPQQKEGGNLDIFCISSEDIKSITTERLTLLIKTDARNIASEIIQKKRTKVSFHLDGPLQDLLSAEIARLIVETKNINVTKKDQKSKEIEEIKKTGIDKIKKPNADCGEGLMKAFAYPTFLKKKIDDGLSSFSENLKSLLVEIKKTLLKILSTLKDFLTQEATLFKKAFTVFSGATPEKSKDKTIHSHWTTILARGGFTFSRKINGKTERSSTEELVKPGIYWLFDKKNYYVSTLPITTAINVANNPIVVPIIFIIMISLIWTNRLPFALNPAEAYLLTAALLFYLLKHIAERVSAQYLKKDQKEQETHRRVFGIMIPAAMMAILLVTIGLALGTGLLGHISNSVLIASVAFALPGLFIGLPFVLLGRGFIAPLNKLQFNSSDPAWLVLTAAMLAGIAVGLFEGGVTSSPLVFLMIFAAPLIVSVKYAETNKDSQGTTDIATSRRNTSNISGKQTTLRLPAKASLETTAAGPGLFDQISSPPSPEPPSSEEDPLLAPQSGQPKTPTP